jgi:hypothetical protein
MNKSTITPHRVTIHSFSNKKKKISFYFFLLLSFQSITKINIIKNFYLFIIHFVNQIEQTTFFFDISLNKKLIAIAFNKRHHETFTTQQLSVCMQATHFVDIAIVRLFFF